MSFKSSRFFYITKNSRQKLKYLENEKRFYGELKSIFHHFQRAFIETNKKNLLLEGESLTLINKICKTHHKTLQVVYHEYNKSYEEHLQLRDTHREK